MEHLIVSEHLRRYLTISNESLFRVPVSITHDEITVVILVATSRNYLENMTSVSVKFTVHPYMTYCRIDDPKSNQWSGDNFWMEWGSENLNTVLDSSSSPRDIYFWISDILNTLHSYFEKTVRFGCFCTGNIWLNS